MAYSSFPSLFCHWYLKSLGYIFPHSNGLLKSQLCGSENSWLGFFWENILSFITYCCHYHWRYNWFSSFDPPKWLLENATAYSLAIASEIYLLQNQKLPLQLLSTWKRKRRMKRKQKMTKEKENEKENEMSFLKTGQDYVALIYSASEKWGSSLGF